VEQQRQQQLLHMTATQGYVDEQQQQCSGGIPGDDGAEEPHCGMTAMPWVPTWGMIIPCCVPMGLQPLFWGGPELWNASADAAHTTQLEEWRLKEASLFQKIAELEQALLRARDDQSSESSARTAAAERENWQQAAAVAAAEAWHLEEASLLGKIQEMERELRRSNESAAVDKAAALGAQDEARLLRRDLQATDAKLQRAVANLQAIRMEHKQVCDDLALTEAQLQNCKDARLRANSWPRAAQEDVRGGHAQENKEVVLATVKQDGTAFQHAADDEKAEKLTVSLAAYNALIDACTRSNDMARVPQILQDMASDGLEPNIVTYSTIIKGYCLVKRLDKAMELLHEMKQSSRYRADEITYNTLIDGCARFGHFDRVWCVRKEMQQNKEVVMATVKQDGTALQHAADDEKPNKEVVLATVKQDGTALQHAADDEKQDTSASLTTERETPPQQFDIAVEEGEAAEEAFFPGKVPPWPGFLGIDGHAVEEASMEWCKATPERSFADFMAASPTDKEPTSAPDNSNMAGEAVKEKMEDTHSTAQAEEEDEDAKGENTTQGAELHADSNPAADTCKENAYKLQWRWHRNRWQWQCQGCQRWCVQTDCFCVKCEWTPPSRCLATRYRRQRIAPS